MHSNDSMSYLGIALCVYLLCRCIEKNFHWRWLLAWSLLTSIVVFTKHTALIVLPICLPVFALAYLKAGAEERRKTLVHCGLPRYQRVGDMRAHKPSPTCNKHFRHEYTLLYWLA